MGSIGDRTFKVNFTGEGAAKLRETVRDKLKEFMGDYTDDTLVEYVVVLLRNGRRKDEARNELDVFLGDESDSFVTWLWDHLASNLDSYIQPHEPKVLDLPKIKPKLEEQAGGIDLQDNDSEVEKLKFNRLPKSRHNREWKGLGRDVFEPPPLRSSEIKDFHVEEKPHRRTDRAKKSLSPRPLLQRKRSRSDEQQHVKRDGSSQGIDAPRRLLQFAVRDAVATSRPSDSASESSLKRLRSVVSTSTGDLAVGDHPQRIRPIAGVPNSMATVFKAAVAEAAQDARKVKPSGSVFDRIGRSVNLSVPDLPEHEEDVMEDDEYEDFNPILEHIQSPYLERQDINQEHDGEMAIEESEAGHSLDYVPHGLPDSSGITQIMSGRSRIVDPPVGQFVVGKKIDQSIGVVQDRDQDQVAVMPDTSRLSVTSSENANALKLPRHQAPRRVPEFNIQTSLKENATRIVKSNGVVEENGSSNGIEQAKSDRSAQSESQKSQPITGLATSRALEDSDARTVFVSNVHIAATKDNLSQHFNKFGEVLKVIINTDAATGQPIGSAVVEFTKKEAADSALSLDGSFFMSRALKVVKRNFALTKPAAMAWPRAVRSVPYARFPRVSFPRGMPGAYRSRLPLKTGARSLQWKRDAQNTTTDSSAVSANNVPSFTVRKFTYVRTEAKPDGNASTT